MTAPVKPVGFNVLVEVVRVQNKSAGGILLSTGTEEERERKAQEIVRIVAFGPIAFHGYSGCESPEDWGVKEGDIVELWGRYDGKMSRAGDYSPEYKNYRYVSDRDIAGLAQGEFLEMIEGQGDE